MAEERRALIDINTGKVINVVIYDSDKLWDIPVDTELLSEKFSIGASIGDMWDGNKIIKAIPPLTEKDVAAEILQYGILVKAAVEDNKDVWALLKSEDRINTLAKIIGLIK